MRRLLILLLLGNAIVPACLHSSMEYFPTLFILPVRVALSGKLHSGSWGASTSIIGKYWLQAMPGAESSILLSSEVDSFCTILDPTFFQKWLHFCYS
jgi:sugar phosphate permease